MFPLHEPGIINLNVYWFIRLEKSPPFCLSLSKSMWTALPASPSPLRRETEGGGRGARRCAKNVIYAASYRRISPLARRVLPGILSSLCPPWCSGVGAARGVPEEREDYRLLGDAWWWISNSTVAPLNWGPTGSTDIKMATLLHPGNPRNRLELRLHPHAKSRNKPLSQIT